MTTSTTQQDVLLAILAMDSYSRGSNVLLTDGGESKLTVNIGGATFFGDSDFIPGAVGAGFSASEYRLSDGTKVIAYRGTDINLSSASGVAGPVNGNFTISVVC